MARTRLFGQLRQIAARALAARPSVERPRPNGKGANWTRRELGLGALQLGVAGVLAGCGGDDGEPQPARVAIIGAGIAGLHCAYRLQEAGADVTVYEGSKRVGGRMFSVKDDAYDGQVIELGGELIDTNHATLFALADEFDIQLDDRLAEGSLQPDVWFVNGAEVPEATIVEQFGKVAPAMADAVAAADADDSTTFDELNLMPLSDWLDQNVPPDEYAELNAILTCAYRGEFGLETDEQSALNLLYLIGADEPDPFRIFGESDERYHAHEGSNIFPTRLAEALREGTVKLGMKLTKLSGDDASGFTLELAEAESGKIIRAHADYVVSAIPFSTLRKVKLDVPLSDTKRQIIDELGYGTNAKVMGSFERPVWREDHAKSGSVTSDLPLQQVWDTSIGQAGTRGILTNFLGGSAGVSVGEGDAEDYYTGLLSDIERLFPGTAEAYRAGSARRMHWPSHELTLGSYTCYKPGQWDFYEHEGEREGKLLFCGEHTSVDFQGWMEGGAETGALVAAELIAELGLKPSARLAKLLGIKTVVPQPALRTGGVAKLGFRARQRLLAEARAARTPATLP